MPTYTPLGTKVQLVSCDLAESTSSKLYKAKKDAGTESRRTEQLCLQASPLAETHIPWLEDNTRLHFVGSVPCYLVQAGNGLFESRTKPSAAGTDAINGQDLGESAPVEALVSPDTPRAIGVRITLSPNTFVESFENAPKDPRGQARKLPRYDIKYDVYFNGELVVSEFQGAAYGTKRQVPTFEDGNVRIHFGKRVNMLFERPWVIVPPSQKADGSVREASTAPVVDAEELWKDIGSELLKRADELGYNKREQRRTSGLYLFDLANMPPPESLASLQAERGHRFGVIDVVFTTGKGAKGPGAMSEVRTAFPPLMSPAVLVDHRYKRMPAGWQPGSDDFGQRAAKRPEVAAAKVPELRDRKLQSTAASERSKRNVAVPVSYADRKARKSDIEAPQLASRQSPTREPSPPRSPILPPFPTTLPQLDFNDIIAVTPTKAEEERRNRGLREASPSIQAATRSKSDNPMRPPPLIPRSTGKRRHSDTLVAISSPSTWQASGSPRPGGSPGSKSVSKYMGMTKRGVLSRSAKTMVLGTSPGPALMGSRSLSSQVIKRVVITAGDTPVLDKHLTSPYRLKQTVTQDTNSPSPVHQPLHESVLFSTIKGMKAVATPAPLVSATTVVASAAASRSMVAISPFVNAPQLPPPQQVASATSPTSSPAKATTSPPKATPSPLKSSMQPGTPTPASAKPKASSEGSVLDQECAKWHLPELSKDCVITYTEEGVWLEGEGAKGGLMRHVKSSRAGLFEENEVLFAVRYVIAGE